MRCQVEQLGTVDYARGLEIQRERVLERKAKTIPDTLLLLEHPHVYTLGRNARREHLLISANRLQALGASLFETDRGGDITYHGPGQLVGYPIFDLTQHRRDVAWYMRSLEEVFLGVASDFGIEARRIPSLTGVWVGEAKLVAMGVHISRWVTSHGFAFNVNTDLSYFQSIVPCGITNKGVTSLEKLLGHTVTLQEAAARTVTHFGRVFGMEMRIPAAEALALGGTSKEDASASPCR